MSAKPKSKSSRLGMLTTQLTEYWDSKKNQDKEQLKSLTGKLHQLLTTQEKCCRDLMSKYIGSVSVLLEIMQSSSSSDHPICHNIAALFLHIATLGKRCIQQLSSAGVLSVTCECLVILSATNLSKGLSSITEDLYVTFFSLINKIANKDKRFGAMARLSGAVQSTLDVLRAYSGNTRLLLAVLPVLKTYCNSGVNCNLLIKNDVVNVLVKILPTCGSKKIALLKNCLDLLSCLCKFKNGASKAVDVGLIGLLLSLYQEWQRTDQRNRHVNLRKSMLVNIKTLINYSFGKKAFLMANGYKMLYLLGLEVIESKDLDSLFQVLIIILRKCSNVSKLPVKRATFLSFDLPEHYSVLFDKADDTSQEDCPNEGFQLSNDDSSEHDDGVEEKEERKSKRENTILLTDVKASTDDLPEAYLEYYKQFFNELYQFEKHQEANCLQSDDGEESTSIHIPTASNESYIEDDPINVVFVDEKQPNKTNVTDEAVEHKLTKDIDNSLINSCEDIEYLINNFKLQTVNNTTNHLIEDLNYDITLNCGEDAVNDSHGNTFNEICSASTATLFDTPLRVTNTDQRCYLNENNIQVAENKSTLGSVGYEHLKPMIYTNDEKEDLDQVNHVLPFIKKAEPEIYGHNATFVDEPLVIKKTVSARQSIFQDFARSLYPEQCINKVVYDLDALLDKSSKKSDSLVLKDDLSSQKSPSRKRCQSNSRQQSRDDMKKELEQPLFFDSRFECGNLRKAIQIRDYEYDLILNPDVNSNHHHQWFYFQVSNMSANIPYRFNIINCEKPNSQFNFGMQPVFYSVSAAKSGQSKWHRAGSNITYYRNIYARTPLKNYFTATFTLSFQHTNDTCYLAYHYPYSATMLNMHLCRLESSLIPMILFEKQTLCKSLNNNDVPLITITSLPTSRRPYIDPRPYIVLTARVHPGESNASWIMKGILDFLLSNHEDARKLRTLYVFKIVPMLNPDGVINGCHRCSLTGQDLNRQWLRPNAELHPSIYHAKSLMKYLLKLNKPPILFVDIHGHSRKKNIFMYGCQSIENKSVMSVTNDNEYLSDINENIQIFPQILSSVSPYFSLRNCSYSMEKCKEATARIVAFKELGIKRSYTMESTYCGFDQGACKGYQITTDELEMMGEYFCKSLLRLSFTSDVTNEILTQCSS